MREDGLGGSRPLKDWFLRLTSFVLYKDVLCDTSGGSVFSPGPFILLKCKTFSIVNILLNNVSLYLIG